jgi:glutamyl-tRNA reductase
MSIQLISISHKIAPLEIRELFAFSKEQQSHIRKAMIEETFIDECVVLSTCNRTEIYTYTSPDHSIREIYGAMQKILLAEASAEDKENINDYILFYHGKKAIHHLFQVTTGLDSMVMGEDQILGQVKNAHEDARNDQSCGVYLNTLFRYAVTASKKVKTDTSLSKTSVSTGTLAVKIAEEELEGGLHGKKVLVIGASGKIGSIVLKNLVSLGYAELFATTRNMGSFEGGHHKQDAYMLVPYQDRYELMDEMDVIISATSSPHYTITAEKAAKTLRNEKKRVFIDLAVPMDIDEKVAELPGAVSYNIDDFTRIAEENNKKKLNEVDAADEILEDYELQFEQWFIFQKSLPVMNTMRDNFLKVAEHKGVRNAFDHLFYWVRENNSPEDLQAFFRCLDH